VASVKSKELSQEACDDDPELRLVRGFYHCTTWSSKQQQWWCEYPDGRIVDPSVKQFPDRRIAQQSPQLFYEEFDGICECDECGKRILEAEARFDSNYVFCSSSCNMRFVGL